MAAGTGIFLIYVLTLSPSTAMWDTSEYIATAHILGIPHPPGNPLFVVLSKSWSLLMAPLGLPVAVRINLLAAATSAAAGAFYFLVAHRILLGAFSGGKGRGTEEVEKPRGSDVPESEEASGEGFWEDSARVVPLVGGYLAVLLSGTAFTVWNQSTVNEKVYTVSVMIIAASIWLVLRWRDLKEEPRGLRYLLGAVYLMTLGSTNHLMSVLPLPALGLFVLLVSPAVLLKKALWVRLVPLVIIGLSFNFFLPIRADEDPVINEGDPTCESLASATVSVYSNGKAGCPNLSRVLSRFQYQKPPVYERQAPLGAQILNYFQYFDWQWARGMDPSELPRGGRFPITFLFMALGAWGLWMTWRADRNTFLLMGALTLTLTAGLVFYLNFKYGYSLAPEITEQGRHEVRERDYFFIASFGLWGVLAALGLAALWEKLSVWVKSPRGLLFSAPVLVIALIPMITNWSWASRKGDWATRDWAYNLLMSVEPYGIIFTNGDNDTFPLWYVQEVEGIRQDVTVIVGQYVYTPWYPKQLQELTTPGRQRPFRPEIVPGLYPEPESPPPNPIITLSHEELDRIQATQTPEAFTLPLGDVAVQYPAGTYLDRGDQLTLAIIYDSIDERPIYFATPSGILGRLGLEPWAVRQGLAAKLVLRKLDDPPPPGVVKTSAAVGEDWFDVPRTMKLLEEVYSYRGFEDRLVWADRSTLNIPWYFYATAVQASDAVGRWEGGTEEQVLWLREKAEAFAVTAQGGYLSAPLLQ